MIWSALGVGMSTLRPSKIPYTVADELSRAIEPSMSSATGSRYQRRLSPVAATSLAWPVGSQLKLIALFHMRSQTARRIRGATTVDRDILVCVVGPPRNDGRLTADSPGGPARQIPPQRSGTLRQ
jgi:hypothetical protein